jgi:hypothetical protein
MLSDRARSVRSEHLHPQTQMSCHIATFAKDPGPVVSCHVATFTFTFAKNLGTNDIDICPNPRDKYAHGNTSRCAQSAVLLAAVVAAPPRRNARADACRGHRKSAEFDLNNLRKLGSLRQGHHLQGGTVRAHLWPHSSPPMHTRISLSPTDPLHTLPLTTCLALCRAFRRLASTSILLEKIFHIARKRRERSGRSL